MTDSNETLNSFHTTNLATTATFSSKSLSLRFSAAATPAALSTIAKYLPILQIEKEKKVSVLLKYSPILVDRRKCKKNILVTFWKKSLAFFLGSYIWRLPIQKQRKINTEYLLIRSLLSKTSVVCCRKDFFLPLFKCSAQFETIFSFWLDRQLRLIGTIQNHGPRSNAIKLFTHQSGQTKIIFEIWM